MATLGEDNQSKLSSFVFKSSLPSGSLAAEEQKAIDHLLGKIIKEWPHDGDATYDLGLLTGYSFYKEFFGPVLCREYNVALNGLSTSQDKAVSLVSDIVVIFYLTFNYHSWMD